MPTMMLVYAIIIWLQYINCTKIVLFHYADTTLTTEDLSVLADKLNPVAYRWYQLGVQLRFQTGVLRRIQHPGSGDASIALADLLDAWLKRTSPPSTLRSLVEAVAGSVIANQALAEQLIKECEKIPTIKRKVKLL